MDKKNKVFFIGFNKCGTVTLHKLLKLNGYRSGHCRVRALPFLPRRHIALLLERNIAAGKPILTGMTRYDALSDMTFVDGNVAINGNTRFRELHAEYPGAFFVLNERPVESWIRSRVKHRNGDFLARSAAASGLAADEIKGQWRREFEDHSRDVLDYFSGYRRFLRFNIELDDPNTLVNFLKSGFNLDVKHWAHHNRT